MNYGYTEENVLRILHEANALTEEEFKRDFERWKVEWPKCLDIGDRQIKMITGFITPRTEYMRDSIAGSFGFTQRIVFSNPTPERGKLYVNGYEVKEPAVYFKDMAVEIKIETENGWESLGLIEENGQELEDGDVLLAKAGKYVVRFEED